MSIKKYTNGSWTPACRKYGTETDSITTLPVTIIGDGTPIMSYTIKGNMEQNGAPTPSSPIYPSECGERTENLFDGEMESGYYDNNGEKQSNNNWIRCKNLISADSNTIYHVIIDAPAGTSGSVVFARCYDARGEYIGTANQTVIQYYKEYAFTTLNDTKFISFYISVAYDGAKIALYQTTISGKAYIPYGYKLPLTSAGQNVDIYLGESQTTRRIKKLVFDGTETIAEESANVYSIPITDAVTMGVGLSTHFVYDNSISDGQFRVEAEKVVFGYNDTLANFSTFLAAQYAAGTPVTIWYVLAEPTTGIVNEPIRKIGDYVDSISGTNLATTGTAQEFDVGTALKPSEADLTYHGWHEHEDTKYST